MVLPLKEELIVTFYSLLPLQINKDRHANLSENVNAVKLTLPSAVILPYAFCGRKGNLIGLLPQRCLPRIFSGSSSESWRGYIYCGLIQFLQSSYKIRVKRSIKIHGYSSPKLVTLKVKKNRNIKPTVAY